MKAGVRYWVMIAVLLGATTGMAYLSHGESVPPAKPLTEFPVQVGPYTKVVDWKIDKTTLDFLHVTDYLDRGYWKPGMNQDLIGLYVAYLRSQRTGASIHSPKNCLPGRGLESHAILDLSSCRWTMDAKCPSISTSCAKGSDEEVVLYWYQAHGRIVASEYWGKFYLVYDALRLNRTDAALVRITIPVLAGR